MKTLSFIQPFALVLFAATASLTPALAQPAGGGRGMPPEARESIHALFANHSQVRREVTLTPDGYTALTESDDPKVAAVLKKHVKQMQSRLASGLSARRWDPAFAEYCDHYSQMDHEFAVTAKGVRLSVKGRNPTAAKIARNHAKIISAFAAHGWSEHDKRHASVSR